MAMWPGMCRRDHVVNQEQRAGWPDWDFIIYLLPRITFQGHVLRTLRAAD